MEKAEPPTPFHRPSTAARQGPPACDSAVQRGLSTLQATVVAVAVMVFGTIAGLRPEVIVPALEVGAAAAFLFVACWRILLTLLSLRVASPTPTLPAARLPRYTVVAALHDEAEVVGQLIARLGRIDYPPDQLQGFLVLEAHDLETIAQARHAPRPPWLDILIAPAGLPQTKPRALNVALGHATGELLTVYDAEDDPDPGQLREAAARFAADRGGRLACLQAPLRIRRRFQCPEPSPFLDRQFALEYASLFETVLPGLARLGLPFPLGGTSNHFRVDVLRALGGWDAWNVTEDADLGFRLWRDGWRLGVLARPTWETPPGGLNAWLPQRARWLKGYMQTFGVHTRKPWRLGFRGAFALVMTVGAGLASAALHGPSLAWFAAALLVTGVAGLPPATSPMALGVLFFGAVSAWVSCGVGARRAGIRFSVADMIAAPAYWSLLSLAFVHAAWRLAREPFVWDKTRHRRDAPDIGSAGITPLRAYHAALDEDALPGLSAPHAAAPEHVA